MRWSKGMTLVVAAVAVTALACEKGGSGGERSEKKGAVGYAPARGESGTGGGGEVAARPRPDVANQGVAEQVAAPSVMTTDMVTAVATPGTPDQLPSPTPGPAANAMIIRTGNATIKVDSLEPAVARLRTLAMSVGGYVGNTSIQTGTDQLRSATVEIKVPAPRWSQLVSGLKPIGTLESLQEGAEDVGEEFVDVQARVANARRLEARLIDLLANRTGKLSDALQVERELARVREEIERYEGRIRYLQTQAAISTMTVTVHEPAPVLGSHPGDNPIAQAFRNAWRNFVGMLAFLISSLGVILPLGALAWLAWWLLRGRRPRAKTD